uniref:Uncharacterized protein n=1 Tax=Meloidogyne enterolobii TaxID=390850 RepID=A0A6V7UCV4_MELEN|nr:unnamed protein product [Meloidogyne enterolobii]
MNSINFSEYNNFLHSFEYTFFNPKVFVKSKSTCNYPRFSNFPSTQFFSYCHPRGDNLNNNDHWSFKKDYYFFFFIFSFPFSIFYALSSFIHSHIYFDLVCKSTEIFFENK